MAAIELQNIRKSYQAVDVIHGLDLVIPDGSFTVLVGPSGCGKSTLLRMIAGLEDITGGQVSIDGARCDHLLPSARGMAMVFQSYALYPHMSVEENLRFGLENHRLPKAEIDERVAKAADILQIQHLLKRRPSQLSGGQSQRVAIGRAIVKQPKAFLFDEPLSNLDAELRIRMRRELSALHKRLGSTMVYVTHDQVEAMTMADQIVVLNEGHIEQVGSPVELYARPASLFVARFLGAPPMNLLKATVIAADTLELAGGTRVALPGRNLGLPPGAAVTLGLRPEHAQVGAEGLHITVTSTEILGSGTILHGTASTGEDFSISMRGISGAKSGDTLHVVLDPRFVHVFDGAGVAVGATDDWQADYLVS
ncbi:ABC transporter ATP-binding protein [Devosia riboflavina]|uniref:ABC transporter ATP-binding protein n=2 Tax=Devosia riboflavina TaxID=46914 RepID=A0A087M5L7_9HYPH|nr:ABC transporter ATP-binding protein [Devosia riboflavina]